ncbi:nuclear transport factor 2 family protein [Enterobacter wuhouensis]|uniref:nuclear transport factor 2 family protein n=1 Tax=Enterobacter wuhouensis TaxID=2529381 RepID=UPI002FD2D96E
MNTKRIHQILDELLNQHELPLEATVDRYFATEYRQKTNGQWDDRKNFVLHMSHLREILKSAEINVLDELRDGDRYATHHKITANKRDGACVIMEVYMFATLDAEGRFTRVEETTLMLAGSEADRSMGNAK